MKETLIILGAGVMQGPAISIAKELGFFTIALDGSSSAPCVSMADQFEQIDLKDKEGIEAFARSVQGKVKKLGIMTAGTDFSASVAWTAEKLGLPGVPYEAALNASDKALMRKCFKKEGLPSPDFFTMTAVTNADTRGLAAGNTEIYKVETTAASGAPITFFYPIPEVSFSLSFPAVIKPADNMGSRGCRRLDGMSEFEEALKNAVRFSRSKRAIVETFMDGPEFSVDAIVYHGEITICGLADRHIYFPPYFIEMGHTMPSEIDEEKQYAILETFRSGIKALGLAGRDSVGAAKGDIKFTSQGPMIGEIAARLSGGYMSGWTYPYSSGILPIKAAIQAAMGNKPDDLTPRKKWTCAERAFISIPGTVKKILFMDQEIVECEQSASKKIDDLFLRVKEGDKVAFPENNVSKCGNIIASSPERETAITSAENAARSILIRLDPRDNETERFLSESNDFPPDAYKLPKELKTALSQLPEYINNTCADSRGPSQAKVKIINGNPDSWSIISFKVFESSGIRDYMGRTVGETLDAVRALTGFPLPVTSDYAENKITLGRSFWRVLIRGSYQGAVFYVDKLRDK